MHDWNLFHDLHPTHNSSWRAWLFLLKKHVLLTCSFVLLRLSSVQAAKGSKRRAAGMWSPMGRTHLMDMQGIEDKWSRTILLWLLDTPTASFHIKIIACLMLVESTLMTLQPTWTITPALPFQNTAFPSGCLTELQMNGQRCHSSHLHIIRGSSPCWM